MEIYSIIFIFKRVCYNDTGDIMTYNNPFPYSDDNKRYHTWNYYLKHRFHQKVFKVPLNAGFSCPNRDGTCGVGGCTFCSSLGSGDFAGNMKDDLTTQFDQGLAMMRRKWPNGIPMAYFQAYTNTYADLNTLKRCFEPFVLKDDIAAISIATRADCLEDDNIDICGLNCICGPLHMKQLLEKIDTQKKPILIMPNAGYPTVLSNRTYFQDSSDYFASVMKEIYQKGAIVLGGCCGTTPVYIQKLKRNLADLKPAQEIHKTDEQKQKVSVDTNPIRHKLKENKKIVAVEFDPPANCEIDRFISNAQYLKEAGVDAITIADCPIARARVDSSLLACKLHRELDIEIIPHMTCRDRNINATKALLFGLQIEGISNVLVVTGDPIPSEDRQEVKAVFNFNSQILANYIQDLNQTMFPHPFLIFGALNINAVNFEAELQKAKQKMKHGVEGFLTQPVHSQRALDNLKKAKQELDAYLLGGVLPIVSHRNAVYMNNEISGIEVDEQLVACYEGKTREEAQQLAIDISCQTIDAMKDYVDGYYLITPFNRVEIIGSIISYIHKQEERA